MPVTLTDEQVAELRARLGQAETNAKIAEARWRHSAAALDHRP